MTTLQNSLAGVKVDTSRLAGGIELRIKALVRGREVARLGKVSRSLLGYFSLFVPSPLSFRTDG